MRKLLLFIVLFCHLSLLTFAQTAVLGTSISAEPISENKGFVATTQDLDALKIRQVELSSTIKLEKERVLDEVKKKNEIQSLLTEIDILLREVANFSIQKSVLINEDDSQAQVKDITEQLANKKSTALQKMLLLANKLDFGSYESDVSFSELQADFPSLKRLATNTLIAQEKKISEAEGKRQLFLEQKNKELEEVVVNIERLQEIRSHQIYKSLQQIGWYVLVFGFIYLLRVFSSRLLVRFGRDFSKSHQEALVLTHRWLFHILFIGAILMIFSAEFMSFLPFLAILSTAVGFALRDVVSSFIGWFVIGANSGYQEGDLVEFDSIVGRVSSVTPLLTTIEEYGPQ